MNSTRDDRAWRRIAIGSFLTLLCVTVAWNIAAILIDTSGLDDGGAWVTTSMFSLLGTIYFGGPAVLMSLVVMGVAASGVPEVARACAWLGAAVAAACSVGLMLFGSVVSGSSAASAFGVASILLALVLLGPLVLCIRKASNERARGLTATFRSPEPTTRHPVSATRRGRGASKLGCHCLPTHLGSSGASGDP